MDPRSEEASQPAPTLDGLIEAYRREVNFPRVLRRSAPVSLALLLAVAALHLLMMVFSATVGQGLARPEAPAFELALMFGAKINALVLDGQYWRLSSALFLHGGLLHLAFNGYALYLLGPLLEKLYGSQRFLILYIASGVISEAASVVFTDGPSVGASGALFGLLGALLVFGWKFRDLLPPRVSRAFGIGLLPWVVINVVIGFIPGLPFDNAAHIGGLIGGALLALPMSTTLKGSPSRPSRLALEVGFFLAFVAIAYGLVFMLRQILLCATSAAEFYQCHPPAMLGL